MTFEEFLLHRDRNAARFRALANERRQVQALAPVAAEDPVRAAVTRLATGGGLPIGRTESGEIVTVPIGLLLAAGVVIGASNSGKTYGLLRLLVLISRWIAGILPGITPIGLDAEIEVLDPKDELVLELQKAVAALLLRLPDADAERLAGLIHTIAWSREWVTPYAPFDNVAGLVSDAYLALLRLDVMRQTGSLVASDAVEFIIYMYFRVLIARRFPPHPRLAALFFTNEAFRARVLRDVPDPSLRDFFGPSFEAQVPRQSAGAAVRRLVKPYPEIFYSECLPPASLERFLPRRETPIVLGSYGASLALPLSMGKERAAHRLTDVLLSAPRRERRRPKGIFIEEAPVLLSGAASEFTETVVSAARTLRSVGVGLIFVAQSMEGTLPADVVQNLRLNTQSWTVFRCEREAEWIFPHVTPTAAEDELSEAERRRRFRGAMEVLEQRRFYFLAKSYGPAIPLRTLDVPSPERVSGRSEEDLLEYYRTYVASRSMISTAVAAEEIAAWEAEVLDRQELPPAPPPRRGAAPIRGLADLLSRLDGEDVDA